MQDVLFCHFSSILDLISVVSLINPVRRSLKLYPSFVSSPNKQISSWRSRFPDCLSESFKVVVTRQLYTQVSVAILIVYDYFPCEEVLQSLKYTKNHQTCEY